MIINLIIMKKLNSIYWIVASIVFLNFACHHTGDAEHRKTCIDENWRFQLGDIKNAEMPGYDDSEWKVIDLPHDWSIEPLAKQKKG